jgi:rsbT co-antagonist protein RsbR
MELSINALLAKFNISDNDLAIVAKAGELILPILPSIVDKYCQWVRNSPDLMAIFLDAQGVKQNGELKFAHWTSVWKAKIDQEYIAFRQNLGKLHADLGISLEQYFSVVTTYLNLYEQAFKQLGIDNYELASAFSKVVNLDISIVLSAYSTAHTNILRSQNEALMLMSTPIAQLWDSILLLPLVGVVDSKRAQDIMSNMLQKVMHSQARVFILDISGVAVVDTAVGNHFIKITKATKLMGCRTIISGISPAIAQTIVELGVQIDEIMTTNSMQDALKDAFRLTNVAM